MQLKKKIYSEISICRIVTNVVAQYIVVDIKNAVFLVNMTIN